MKTEIISVGTELLVGQITNTNAQYLSRRLNDLGLDVYYQTTVGDNLNRLIDALKAAAARVDVILLSGGLGPTEDDLTREAVCRFADRPLVRDKVAEASVRAFFERLDRPMTDNNLRQAERPEGAHPLPNDIGLAIGWVLELPDGKIVMALPGPPRELQTMFERYGRPYLKARLPETKPLFSRYLHFAGIGESQLATRLEPFIQEQDDPTIALYASVGEVMVRLSTRAENEREAQIKLQPLMDAVIRLAPDFYYGEGESLTLSQILIDTLIRRGETLALVESCTGGLIADTLIGVPGASAVLRLGVIPYQTIMKAKVLGLDAEKLAEHGAVSTWTAERMAEAGRTLALSNWAVATTCVAGPTTQDGQPVGRAYIGLAHESGVYVHEHTVSGDRQTIRERIMRLALFELWQAILQTHQ
ncbi:MAG: C-terminal domain of CinA type S [Candidatus Carbobacillus altaicus]|uniref:Putative competence-damage inducible protein n=1 Tax=Candidatus Carbonibacillus altaicus TaxID=2163959 RepID=A0A2R6XZP9_9BACL|nr:MAG: C-terminal domain of CinA type S [Candidatus Carbobacillus altaicus]